MNNTVSSLLDQIHLISEKNTAILDATGERFNMFSACGVDHYENTHSRIIKELLDTKGSHGFHSEFLRLFCEEVGFDLLDIGTASVVTEENINGNGRLDILVTDANKHALIIENKIYAGDQQEQLKRYAKFAEDKYGTNNYRLLYLTLSGHEATEQSAGDIEYGRISYQKTIISWLEKCLGIAVRVPVVRETIVQYINHLKQLTHQDMNTHNIEEIVKMVCDDQLKLESAAYIHDNWTRFESALHQKVLIDTFEKLGKTLGLDFHLDGDFRNAAKDSSIALTESDSPGKIVLYWDAGKTLLLGILQKNGDNFNDLQVNNIRGKINAPSSPYYKNRAWVAVIQNPHGWSGLTWSERQNKIPKYLERTVQTMIESLKAHRVAKQ